MSTADDAPAIAAVDAVRSWMTEPERLSFTSLETIVAAARRIGGDVGVWAGAFERRYVVTE